MAETFIEKEYEKYVNLEGVNFSLLKNYLRSPLHFKYEYEKWKKDRLEKEEKEDDKKQFVIGKALHYCVLQPDLYSKFYGLIDLAKKPVSHADFRNTQNMEWKKNTIAELQTSGKTIISVDENALIQGMASSIRKNKIASGILKTSTLEKSISWTDPDTGVSCKGTPDCDNRDSGYVTDVKTMDDASKFGFRKALTTNKLYLQPIFYGDGAEILDGVKRTRYYFICVEKKPPYAVAIYVLNEFTEFIARKTYKGLLALHKKCEEEQKWGGYELFGDEKYGITEISINDAEQNFLENHPLLLQFS